MRVRIGVACAVCRDAAMPRYDALPVNLPPRGLAREAAAQYVGISPAKFDALVEDGRMPKPVRIDARTIWDRRALDQAFDALGGDGQLENPWDEIFQNTATKSSRNK